MKVIEKAKKFVDGAKQWVSENPGSAITCALVGAFIGGYIGAGQTYKEAYGNGFHHGQDDIMNKLYSETENHAGMFEENFRRRTDGARMNVRCTMLDSKTFDF